MTIITKLSVLLWFLKEYLIYIKSNLFAGVSSSAADDGDVDKARKTGYISLGFSVAGIALTILIIIIAVSVVATSSSPSSDCDGCSSSYDSCCYSSYTGYYCCWIWHRNHIHVFITFIIYEVYSRTEERFFIVLLRVPNRIVIMKSSSQLRDWIEVTGYVNT